MIGESQIVEKELNPQFEKNYQKALILLKECTEILKQSEAVKN